MRTFTNDETMLDDNVDQDEVIGTNAEGSEAADAENEGAVDNSVGENDETADDENEEGEAEKATPEQLWSAAIETIYAGDNVDAATFAKAFATTTKDAHGRLNELSNASMASLARDNDIDPADKGAFFTEISLLVEAVHGIMPKRSATTGSGVDVAKVALDEATRIVAVIEHVDALREDLVRQVREQSILAGLVTAEGLAEFDNDNPDLLWLPDVDSDSVTFTKKFAESLEYIASVPGGARQGGAAGGASAGEDFSPGDVRYDNKGNAIRFDGTNYFVTLKGQPESGEKFTSSSTAAKKLVTGCETNGKKHFRYDKAPA